MAFDSANDTRLVSGDEFGSTLMNEARGGSTLLGRDHHPHSFSMWFVGGGFKGGALHGRTDEFGYHVVDGKVTIRDLQATLLHQCGLNTPTRSASRSRA